jgi:hypothetical protein
MAKEKKDTTSTRRGAVKPKQTSSSQPAASSSRSFKPLSAFSFGGTSAPVPASLPSGHTSSPPSSKRVKTSQTTGLRSSNGKKSDPVDAIELSSGDSDVNELKIHTGSITEGSDDDDEEVTIVGFRDAPKNPVASTSKSKPVAKKVADADKSTKAISKSASTSPAKAISSKAKGKQRAIDETVTELEVTDARESKCLQSCYLNK